MCQIKCVKHVDTHFIISYKSWYVGGRFIY